MKTQSMLALLGALLLSSCAFGQQTRAQPPQSAPTNVTYASLFSWRDDMKNRLDKLEGKQVAAPAPVPVLPPGVDQTALIYQLRLEIAQLGYQIALLQQGQQNQRQAQPATPPQQPVQPIVLIYSPGGPPIPLNPNPGPVIPLNLNPGPVIPLNPNPGPVIPLNPAPGPVVPLNPNPGTPILLNPVPVPGPGVTNPNPGSPIPLIPSPGTPPKTQPAPPPPTGYQTFTPYVTGRQPATIYHAVWRPAN